MPRVTDEHREARRDQIIRAALVCVQEHGLEGVSMEMIVARSGLSTGAVYRYFKGKDEIIGAGVVSGVGGLAAALAPIMTSPSPPPPAEFLDELLGAAVAYGRGDGELDRMQVAIHGWSYSQTDPELKELMRANFHRMRARGAEVAKRWQAAGYVSPDADPDAIAQLILSICVGFVTQRALAGDADMKAHVAAFAALTAPPAPGS
jgi:AcrR family transcriptional regulator